MRVVEVILNDNGNGFLSIQEQFTQRLG
ncbi:MAG: DNA-binding response regulator [Leuconostoc mesenteroides]|uniref:Uncharacterized protein n=1 Tax=Leuconostoc mesenteroides subsp. mesenteroides (strain ATCC 8293 / DSM 20343 / BCRC 11652 / CCM 1803 / JCM 6124 / NCDO 523 / NBRC 100496 / NCIMB 8023 / NCTC 12954 / NRRL B-1118 / 37Y) TaxID=203120 RepID=Q03VI8_LEUMM|nr:hypothetical protein LEUM_1692 [Leuconostoc mesenteroides subsp. mesenteroides ATCC 8293]